LKIITLNKTITSVNFRLIDIFFTVYHFFLNLFNVFDDVECKLVNWLCYIRELKRFLRQYLGMPVDSVLIEQSRSTDSLNFDLQSPMRKCVYCLFTPCVFPKTSPQKHIFLSHIFPNRIFPYEFFF
jgi:hypothetical protein